MKSKTSLVLPVATVLLFGCATLDDMRKRPPTLELTSSHPAQRVAICIADKWGDATKLRLPAGYPIDTRPTQRGYSVSAIAHNLFETSTGALADIDDTPNGSTTRYFKHGILSAEEPFDNAVKECQ
jgi:hypothetical protein